MDEPYSKAITDNLPLRPRPSIAPPSEHRHRGDAAALQLAGQLESTSHRHVAQLADELAPPADVNGKDLMAIGLDAIWVDVPHQATDLAAGSGVDRHKGR